ncbi:hypothetical protein NC652_019222 [Populus alba x Populus x berolinensis]|nr:hypothetical protein NC652_019222 [Populus alba x Populus x berolinensis]
MCWCIDLKGDCCVFLLGGLSGISFSAQVIAGVVSDTIIPSLLPQFIAWIHVLYQL